MKARIKSKKEVAKGTLLVEYDLLGKTVDFKAGQYFFVTLPKLEFPDERGNSRDFSIVNSPNEKGILSNATRIRDSGYKKTLAWLPVGSMVEVGFPAGSFTLPESVEKPLVFIAGGIGITPFMSILRFVKEEKLPFKITLIYSNRDKDSTAFFDQILELSRKIPFFRLIITMTKDQNWPGEKRRVDSRFLKDYLKDFDNTLFYVAGPPQMNEAVASTLTQIDVRRENIKQENFTGY